MYNNSTHYPNSAYQPSAYPQYQQSYSASYGYQNYGNQYTAQATQPAPPGENFSSENWMPSTTSTYRTSQKDGRNGHLQLVGLYS